MAAIGCLSSVVSIAFGILAGYAYSHEWPTYTVCISGTLCVITALPALPGPFGEPLINLLLSLPGIFSRD